MKPENLMEAFQYLDDDMIESADFIRKNPFPSKNNWIKLLATAACLCLILAGVYRMSAIFIPMGGSSDKQHSNDGAPAEQILDTNDTRGDSDGTESLSKLELPDYTLFQRAVTDNDKMTYYSFLNAEAEGLVDNHSSMSVYEGLIDAVDALPVYNGLTIPSAYILFNDLGILEKELAKITPYNIQGYYFHIDGETAYSLLKEGRYITFTKDKPNLNQPYTMVIVYLYDEEADLAIPYYHFYDKNAVINDGTCPHFLGWFVPAIEEKYITNMPGQ